LRFGPPRTRIISSSAKNSSVMNSSKKYQHSGLEVLMDREST
jgi:hypothetical protein